jgi:hypothetical protein
VEREVALIMSFKHPNIVGAYKVLTRVHNSEVRVDHMSACYAVPVYGVVWCSVPCCRCSRADSVWCVLAALSAGPDAVGGHTPGARPSCRQLSTRPGSRWAAGWQLWRQQGWDDPRGSHTV